MPLPLVNSCPSFPIKTWISEAARLPSLKKSHHFEKEKWKSTFRSEDISDFPLLYHFWCTTTMADFECPVSRIISGRSEGVPGTFRIHGRQLQWGPLDASQGQSFKVALEAITGLVSNTYRTILPWVERRWLRNKTISFCNIGFHVVLKTIAATRILL